MLWLNKSIIKKKTILLTLKRAFRFFLDPWNTGNRVKYELLLVIVENFNFSLKITTCKRPLLGMKQKVYRPLILFILKNEKDFLPKIGEKLRFAQIGSWKSSRSFEFPLSCGSILFEFLMFYYSRISTFLENNYGKWGFRKSSKTDLVANPITSESVARQMRRVGRTFTFPKNQGGMR